MDKASKYSTVLDKVPTTLTKKKEITVWVCSKNTSHTATQNL
jgi:hypothetical protein